MHPNPIVAEAPEKLSICIPTYNRPDALIKTLQVLIPQCELAGCRIHIVDNASTIPVEEIVSRNFGNQRELITISRNRFNIGGNANLCRCFELCETEWMWMLGDDDMVDENALKIIQSAISEADESFCMLNFASNINEKQSSDSIRNFDDLARETSKGVYFGNLLFISSSIYRLPPLRGHIMNAYQFAYSCAPQLILPFLAICDGFSIRNCQEHIVQWMIPEPVEKWNLIFLLLGLGSLSDHPYLRPMNATVIRHAVKCFLGKIRRYVKSGILNLITCPENELQFWASAYLRIASNLNMADKTALIFLSQLACFMRLIKPFRNLIRKVLKLDPAIENLART